MISIKPKTESVLAALIAYTSWGLLPLYWMMFKSRSPVEVLSHRILWSFLSLLPFVLFSFDKSLKAIDRKEFLRICGSSFFLAVNWGLFVFAVPRGFALATSLGYFMVPLCLIGSGILIFGERLNRQKTLALLMLILALFPMLVELDLGTILVSVLIALSWMGYASMRKISRVKPLFGLWLETVVLLPLALFYLFFKYSFSEEISYDVSIFLLVSTGPVTLLPLLFFGFALQSLSMSQVAYFQYLAPFLQLVCATLVFGEPLSNYKIVSVMFILLGIFVASLKWTDFEAIGATKVVTNAGKNAGVS